jgi:hypothetical protein
MQPVPRCWGGMQRGRTRMNEMCNGSTSCLQSGPRARLGSLLGSQVCRRAHAEGLLCNQAVPCSPRRSAVKSSFVAGCLPSASQHQPSQPVSQPAPRQPKVVAAMTSPGHVFLDSDPESHGTSGSPAAASATGAKRGRARGKGRATGEANAKPKACSGAASGRGRGGGVAKKPAPQCLSSVERLLCL